MDICYGSPGSILIHFVNIPHYHLRDNQKENRKTLFEPDFSNNLNKTYRNPNMLPLPRVSVKGMKTRVKNRIYCTLTFLRQSCSNVVGKVARISSL